jgi:hypothetical protein
MKHLLTLVALLTVTHTSFAQPAKPAYAYYEGFNVSMGVSQNTTKDVTNSTSFKSNVGVAKLNYTFALPYPMKLGLTATFDLRNSQINASENLAVSSPSEITIEPGVLLLTNSLLYGKFGTFNANYESGTGVSRKLNGTTYGVGIKHYVYGQNFIQAEWAQRTAENNNAGATGKFKQSTAGVHVGFNY